MTKLNYKRRRKMRRKIYRNDKNWEATLVELVLYEIKTSPKKGSKK